MLQCRIDLEKCMEREVELPIFGFHLSVIFTGRASLGALKMLVTANPSTYPVWN